MNMSIDEIVENLKKEIQEFVTGKDIRIDAAEEYFTDRIKNCVLNCIKVCYETADEKIAADKAGRKAAGLLVERRKDNRQILTWIGMLEYSRTYYKRTSGDYVYPVDEIAGVNQYQRISNKTGLALVESARHLSYAKSSDSVTGGYVSKQTVMNKIRSCNAIRIPNAAQRKVDVLHVDADEDHVKLQDGGSTTVPLISIYEGTDHLGKRGVCKNIFKVSEYGLKTEALWERAVTEIINRYDISNTKIYLHGDGANWILSGLEYLPHSVFVLDPYHKNKALKEAVAGLSFQAATTYERMLRTALRENNRTRFKEIRDQMTLKYPERAASIMAATGYLLKHFDAITIRYRDPEAANGGATEPHISNTLSLRLSSRPMGWSKQTLKAFAPILAAGAAGFGENANNNEQDLIWKCREIKPARFLSGTIGLPDPDNTVDLGNCGGHVTALYNMMKPYRMTPNSL